MKVLEEHKFETVVLLFGSTVILISSVVLHRYLLGRSRTFIFMFSIEARASFVGFFL